MMNPRRPFITRLGSLLLLWCCCASILPFSLALEQSDHRMIAFMGNWQSCPPATQYAEYTHVIIAFAVSYTYSPTKNNCSPTCQIYTPPVCNNGPNAALIANMQAAGTKVLLSFGGSGMGGSWAGSNNDCWEYCFGRETSVVNQLVQLVQSMNLDGVDIDYEYFYEDNQANSNGWTRGDEAINFLRDVTVGLREQLGADKIVIHTPMDSDLVPGSAYYDLMVALGDQYLDFLMPQYYNSITRPNQVGYTGTFQGLSAQSHYNTLLNNIFAGDATRLVFGFCISDCGNTGSNAGATAATTVLTQLSSEHACHGGAFFWVALRDNGWASYVNNNALDNNRGCSAVPIAPVLPPQPIAPVVAPTPVAPVPTPVAPVPTTPVAPPVTSDGLCCPPGFSGRLPWEGCTKFYVCSNGAVIGSIFSCQSGLLFDSTRQVCNWGYLVTCAPENDCAPTDEGESPAPTTMPSPTPTTIPTRFPSPLPSPTPTGLPTLLPSPAPSSQPTATPTVAPGADEVDLSTQPSMNPTSTPIGFPSVVPSFNPTLTPMEAPKLEPTPVAAPNPPPIQAPAAPTDKCCTGTRAFEYRAYDDCRQFYVCKQGQVLSTFRCANGLLFDESRSTCVWNFQFTGECIVDSCGGEPAPAVAPTPPVVSPTAPSPSNEVTSPSPTAVPTEGPSPGPTVTPTDFPSSKPASDDTNDPTLDTVCCPTGYTGLRTFGDCTQYHWCIGGQVSFSVRSCTNGLLFDSKRRVCNWAYNVPICQPRSCQEI